MDRSASHMRPPSIGLSPQAESMARPFPRLLFSEVILCVYIISVIALSSSPKLAGISSAIGLFFAVACIIENHLRFEGGIPMLWLRPIWPMGGFLVLVWFSLFLYPPGFQVAMTYTQVFVLLCIVFVLIRRTGRTWPLEVGFFLGVLVIWYLQGMSFAESTDQGVERFAFTVAEEEEGLNPNLYGNYLLLTILLFSRAIFADPVGVVRSRIRWWKVLFATLGTLLCVQQVIMTTGSRKALLGLLFITAGVFIMYCRGHFNASRVLVGGIISLVLTGVVGGMVGESSHFRRLENLYDHVIGDGTQEGSITQRADLIERGIEFWFESPLFGHGANSFREYVGDGFYSHSNFVELLANFGVLGFVFYYAVHYGALRRAIRLLAFRDSVIRTQVIWFIVGVAFIVLLWDPFAVSYYSKSNAIFLAAAFAVLYRLPAGMDVGR